MQYFVKKIYFFIFLISALFLSTETFGKDSKGKYSRKNISNYFSGIVSANQDHPTAAFEYLNKVHILKNSHHNFNIKFIRTLILLEKFEQAFEFSKDIWVEDEFFFEADLLLGLNYFINKNYPKAQKHFKRLNKTFRYSLSDEDFLSDTLVVWSEASKGNKKESFDFFNTISGRYKNLKGIQKGFLQCYFDFPETQATFKKLINDEEYNFSRYNFFLANYLLFKNRDKEAKKIIANARNTNDSNILIKQAENFILTKNTKKIKNLFDCKNPNDVVAEIFYIMANLYSTQKDYEISNFYLKISLLLNDKFKPNKTLLAENFFHQKKYKLSKNIYNSLKSIGPIYSWYASKNIAIILSDTVGYEHSVSNLQKEFNLLVNPDFQNYYELANFYKDHQYYEESIKYYSLALKNIKQDHFLVAKIFDRRGTSYERIGKWDKAEKDLMKSLSIIPNQAHVLNYLAYSWVEKKININKALEMLERANKLKENDGYIIDSLGWAHYANSNYVEAERFLQRAVELMPLDPIINDHYGDALWMLNKNIQARYMWKYVLGLDEAEQELRENVNKKLIFGITKNL